MSRPDDLAKFFRTLPELLPDGSVLYLEGHPRKEVAQFLEARPVLNPTEIARGTIWPKPKMFHIPATRESLEILAAFADEYIDVEIADHLHVYRADVVLIAWYDFPIDPLSVSRVLPEDQVLEWASQLGCVCELVELPE